MKLFLLVLAALAVMAIGYMICGWAFVGVSAVGILALILCVYADEHEDNDEDEKD